MQSEVKTAIFRRDIPILTFHENFVIEQRYSSVLSTISSYLLRYSVNHRLRSKIELGQILSIEEGYLTKMTIPSIPDYLKGVESEVSIATEEEVELFEKDCNENSKSLRADLKRLLTAAEPKTDPRTLIEFALEFALSRPIV